jgi:hypothetical protein
MLALIDSAGIIARSIVSNDGNMEPSWAIMEYPWTSTQKRARSHSTNKSKSNAVKRRWEVLKLNSPVTCNTPYRQKG